MVRVGLQRQKKKSTDSLHIGVLDIRILLFKYLYAGGTGKSLARPD